MKLFLHDDFLDKNLFKRFKKEIQNSQLDKTISEIDYLNELQSHIISRCDFTEEQMQELEFIKNLNNARKQNLQA